MIQEKRADLHLHTFYSDGTFSPAELVERAKALHLFAISVTDHDTMSGLPEALAAAGKDLEVIPGVELTAAFGDRELHLLGYFIRAEDPTFTSFLEEMHHYRRKRIKAMIDRLRVHGVKVSMEEVESIAGKGVLGRPHLAQALVEKKVVPSLDEAFGRYLGDRAPCFVKGAPLTVPDAVRLIRGAGGVAVLAHPHRLVEDGSIPQLIADGIQGIEVFHSDHNASVRRHYQEIAKRQGVLAAGGSDCHGLRKKNGPLIGSVTIPYEWVERLKAVASGKD